MNKYTNKKKTLITAGLFACFGLVSILGLSTNKEYKNAQAVNTYTENVIYNPNEPYILLEGNEVNYTYEHLYNLLLPDNNLQNIYFTYDNLDFSYDGVLVYGYSYISQDDPDVKIIFINDKDEFNDLYGTGDHVNYQFAFVDITDDSDVPFEHDLQIWTDTIDIVDFVEIQNAIELDIQANQPQNEGETMISAIASGLGLAPSLAQEFLAGFSKIFWDSTNNKLTSFSQFALIMLGIAITMAVIKLVLNLIRSNTGA